jgi:hypothetical protein
MNNPLLETFATKVTAKSRITFGDVCRIRRDVLPDGIASREEAEALLRMDRLIGRADSSWVEWLTNAIVEFAVWSERPTGHIDTEAAAWLAQELMRQGPLTKAGRRIAREIQFEAETVAEPMASVSSDAFEPADERRPEPHHLAAVA